MARTLTYRAPPLKHKVWLRNPDDHPPVQPDRYGVFPDVTIDDGWGVMVWAGRSDRSVDTEPSKGALVRVQFTVWTIRERDGVDANVEIVVGEEVWRSIGPALIRGGTGFGRRDRFLEIHTRKRQ